MRAWVCSVTLAAVLVGTTLVVTANATSNANPPTMTSLERASGPCALVRRDGESIRKLAKRHIRCAVREFGPVPGGAQRAVCIARRESGLLPKARSATGMYLGLFQHAASYWGVRYETWTETAWNLPPSALRGRTNAIVTVRMVADAGRWRRAGWPRHEC